MDHQILIGDCREEITKLSSNSLDAVVTDPPYGLHLHGYDWDSGDTAFCPLFWGEIFRVMKPGAFLVSFASPRFYHHLARATETAGFKLYPYMTWQFSGGLPKPVNVSELFDRDNIADRKPVGYRKGSGFTSANETHGAQQRLTKEFAVYEKCVSPEAKAWEGFYYGNNCLKPTYETILLAQKPPSEKRMIDNIRKHGVGALNLKRLKEKRRSDTWPDPIFHHAKAKKKDHDSSHPSVKPISLMEELCILACPPSGLILDPFAGTGTTAEGAARAGFKSIMIEQNPEMKSVIERRIQRGSLILPV